MTDLHPVRVTIEPGVVREVTDAELVDLARQGLIHSYKHTPAARAVLSGTIPVTEKWQGPAKGEAVVTAGPDLAQPDAAPVANVLNLDDGLGFFKPAYGAVLLDGIAPGGFRRRVIVRKTLPTDSVSTSYKKDSQTVIPMTWTGHWVSASIVPVKIEDATS